MSTNRRHGTLAENGAVTVFAPHFPHCERRVTRGKNDACDLTGLPIPIEVKWNIAAIAQAMQQAKTAATRLGTHGYAAYIHARGKPAEEAYGIVPAWFLAELLACWDHHENGHGP